MIKINQKTVLATAVAGALGLAAAPAQALEAEASGHLNRAILAADNGEDSDTMFVDGEPSNTRVRWVGTQEVSPGLEAGLYMEWELVSSNSSVVDIGANQTGGFDINERHFDASLAGDWGKVSLGQGNGAANGAMEVDLSGTFIAGYSGARDVGQSITFFDDNAGTTSGTTIGDSINQYDFLSRYDRIRYDTPALGPVTVSIATGTIGGEDGTDAAVRYSGDLDAGKLAVAVGYSTVSGDAGAETVGGSASLLLDNGFNVTVALGNRSDDLDGANELDSDTFYGKVGYKSGRNAVSIDFGETSDFNAGGGRDGDFVGVQYVHKPVGWMELYAAAKVHSADGDTGEDLDDISIAFLGTRIKF